MTTYSDPRLDATLPGGLKLGDAVKMAASWWDARGRHFINRENNRDQGIKAFRPISDKGPGIILHNNTQTLPSGIFEAKPWDDLNRREKHLVVKSWYHQAWLPTQAASNDLQ